jgi:hypothetical protein
MGHGNAMERLRLLKAQVLDTPKIVERPRKKKNRGGPNPLSCKKKANPSLSVSNKNQSSTQGLAKKKRIRKKIPKHIIEELKNET